MTRRSTGPSRPLPTSTADLWQTIAADAGQESALWNAALRPREEQERAAVFSPLGEPRYALGIETIYEGYLLHYGRPRLFEPDDQDAALLLGDYLYAHGLVRIAEVGTVDAVADLAELISLCAQLRADSAPGDSRFRKRRTIHGLPRSSPPKPSRISERLRSSGHRGS